MIQVMSRILCGVVALGSVSALLAAGPTSQPAAVSLAQPATLPSTRPAGDAQALVRNLGADDFKQRQAAADQLRKMGKDALPALKEATTSPDPEVQARAQGLIKELEDKDKKPEQVAADPNGIHDVRINGQRFRINNGNVIIQGRAGFGPGAGPIVIGPNGAGGPIIIGPGGNVGGGGMMTIHVTSVTNVNGNQTRDSTVSTNGNTYKLHADADGLKLTITENGKTQEYTAKDAEDLQKKDPEAYKVYEKHFSKDATGPGAIEIKPEPWPTGVVASATMSPGCSRP